MNQSQDFCDFLHFTFKKLDPLLLPYVAQKDFWLFTPSANGSPWWYLLNEDDWMKVARSGLRLGISLFEAKVCPSQVYTYLFYGAHKRIGCEGQRLLAHYYIRFSKPVPSWSSLPEELEFRWW